jgi:uncharacterized protein
MSNALIIFIKNSELGKVKTRLAATVGNDKALAVYQQLLQYTHAIVQPVPANKFVYYSSHIEVADIWSNEHFQKKIQQGNTLGERMCNSFKEVFKEGYHNTCIVGSDCPGITTEIIEQAFQLLQTSELVIGPAIDGGYYLLAIKKMHPELFDNINWSTSAVLQQTLDACRLLRLSVAMLPELADIDDETDLAALENFGTIDYPAKPI